jgi:deoxyguanosine kinase
VSSPRYIAVEGPIGVGKTTLARRLSERLGARLMLERFEENPFLPGFYGDRARYAMKTQLFFLLERFEQQRREALQTELFSEMLVSDYTFAKDRIFAVLTLDPLETRLYERIYEAFAREIPKPDLVIYMTANLDVLLERIRHRGRSFEADFDAAYLEGVRQIYHEHYEHYEDTALLIVDSSQLDLVEDGSSHFERILNIVREGFEGRMEYQLPGALC